MNNEQEQPAQAGQVERRVRPSAYRNFDGMCWPVPGECLDELERLLRYENKDVAFAMNDRLVIASFLSAYRQIVELPERTRNRRINEIRKGPTVPNDEGKRHE